MRRRESEKTARDSHRVLCGKLFEEVDGGAGVALGKLGHGVDVIGISGGEKFRQHNYIAALGKLFESFAHGVEIALFLAPFDIQWQDGNAQIVGEGVHSVVKLSGLIPVYGL